MGQSLHSVTADHAPFGVGEILRGQGWAVSTGSKPGMT